MKINFFGVLWSLIVGDLFMLEQSDSVLFESLRRLQLMELTVDLLKVRIESSLYSHSMSIPFMSSFSASCYFFSGASFSKSSNCFNV